MSAAPTLQSPLITYTNADWLEQPFRFWVGNIATPDSFIGCTFDATLSTIGGNPPIHLTSSAGTLTIALPNMVSITVPLATMATTPPGTYDFELRKTTGGGTKSIILRGQVAVIAGLTP